MEETKHIYPNMQIYIDEVSNSCSPETKQPILLEANKIKGGIADFNFQGYTKNFIKVFQICSKCKFLNKETDFLYCHKQFDLVDHTFCIPKCPLGKWELIDPNNKQKEIKNK